jgi:hypothetical protein
LSFVALSATKLNHGAVSVARDDEVERHHPGQSPGLLRRLLYVAMDDQQVLNRIDKLVQEEEDLLHRHEGEGLSSEDHARMEELKLQLDKMWDYLRQRRALREVGDDPDDASVRDGGTVEDYGTVTDYDDTEPDAPA